MTRISPLQEVLSLMLCPPPDDRAVFVAQNHRHLNLALLAGVGLIRPGGMAETYSCDCGAGGRCEVIWLEHRKDRTRRPIYRCENCGLNRL
ncbi:MAG: hypothetical protein ACRC2T_02720, partial [Thermoguttaceae bacterium]